MPHVTEPEDADLRQPLFIRADWWAALVAALVSGVVYFYTAQPNVGLLD